MASSGNHIQEELYMYSGSVCKIPRVLCHLGFLMSISTVSFIIDAGLQIHTSYGCTKWFTVNAINQCDDTSLMGGQFSGRTDGQRHAGFCEIVLILRVKPLNVQLAD